MCYLAAKINTQKGIIIIIKKIKKQQLTNSLRPLSPPPATSLLSLLQVSLSGSMLDVYGGEQGMNPPSGGMSPTPNCTKLTVKREYTDMNSYCCSADQNY